MPKYEIPAAPPSAETSSPNPTYAIYLPINKEISEAIEVDSNIEVTFKGIVRAIERNEYDDRGDEEDNYSMRVAISAIEVYDENEYEKMARDDD